jgi:hypothetical protein
MLFWKPDTAASAVAIAAPAWQPAADTPMPARPSHSASLALLAGLIAGCAVYAAPLSRYTDAAARQLFEPAGYRHAVLGAQPLPAAFDLRSEMRQRKQAKP